VFDDLAVGDPEDRHTGHFDLLAGGGDAQEFALMRANKREALDDLIALGDQIVGGGFAIGESRERTLVNHLAALAAGRHIRELAVGDQISGDDVIQRDHVVLVVRLAVAADDRLVGLGLGLLRGHGVPPYKDGTIEPYSSAVSQAQ
jgi:hypothetical protein